MADEPPIDREPDDDALPTADPAEGVRLLKADEAAEAVERGDAVRRRDDDRPKYGDRPEAPDGPRPNLRFPLADSADPTAHRPAQGRPRRGAAERGRGPGGRHGAGVRPPRTRLRPA